MKLFWTSSILVGSLVLTSCGNQAATPSENHSSQPNQTKNTMKHLPNGDLQELTASKDILPTFLSTQSKEINQIYQIVANNTDTLQYIPCYCGCADSANHKSNVNCFINEHKPDGSIVWDDHGTRCDVCVNIAIQSAVWKKEGKSVTEIRKNIDTQYGNGQYAKPTPTPMPPTTM